MMETRHTCYPIRFALAQIPIRDIGRILRTQHKPLQQEPLGRLIKQDEPSRLQFLIAVFES